MGEPDSSFSDRDSISNNTAYFRSFEDAFREKKLYEKHNFEQFRMIEADIKANFKQYKEIYSEEIAKLNNDYLTLPEKFKNTYLEHQTIQQEECNLRKQNEEFKEKISAAMKRNETLAEEISSLRNQLKIKEHAFDVAKNYYSSMWGMDISIESCTKYVVTYIIKFSFAENYPLRFVIDQKERQVLRLEGNSLITDEEVENYRDEVEGNRHQFPLLLCKLRALILKKVKEL